MCLAARAALMVLLLALSGCVTTRPPLDLEKYGGVRQLVEPDAVDVAIHDADRHGVDVWITVFGTKMPYGVVTGPELARHFTGAPHSGPLFTIASAKIRETPAFGLFATNVHYVVDGTLSFAGRDYPIHAEGRDRSGGIAFASIAAAVQQGVADAAHQVTAIIASGPDKPKGLAAATLRGL